MSFRKRNVGLATSGSQRGQNTPTTTTQHALHQEEQSGVRPSPADGRPTTSTGLPTLDGLLAGHGGIPLGTSILLEETGTTDYGGALLKFYAAEGIVQGHYVHVLAVGEAWVRDLPGVVGSSESSDQPISRGDKMKIAWRYERLGQFGSSVLSAREPVPETLHSDAQSQAKQAKPAFCHTFDLSKRLVHHPNAHLHFPWSRIGKGSSPLADCLQRVSEEILKSPLGTIHRIVVPSLLSPALYNPQSCSPQHILPFLHGLRALLAMYPRQLTVMITLPLSLYPRSNGLVRWMEILADCVMELAPFPHSADVDTNHVPGSASPDEQPQGLLKLYRLPIFHERGGGDLAVGTDWVFTLSRRRLIIKQYNLPPIEGDTGAQRGDENSRMPAKAVVEF